MARDYIVVGVEIGTSKVCAVVGEGRETGPIKPLGIGCSPSRGVRKGEVIDFETAQRCLREAIQEASAKADVDIHSIFLGVTGSHLEGYSNRGVVNLPDDRDEIDEMDYEDVEVSARDVVIPQANTFLHSIPQGYYVDGQDGVLNPVGMLGRRLEADFHLIHGVSTRMRNSIRCVKELDLHVEEVAFNGWMAAQMVLTPDERDAGALAIDIGGGTIDYVLYMDGVVRQSGVLAVGGDHITNDLSIGLRIPMARAERLKIDEGSAMGGRNDLIHLKADAGFAGAEIEREMLDTIIHCRMEEALQLVRRALEKEGWLEMLGAGIVLTGGGSQLRGIIELAEEVFDLPARLAFEPGMSKAIADDPKFSTVMGLLYFGRDFYANQPEEPGLLGKLGRIFRR